MTQRTARRFESCQTEWCRGDVRATKTEFLDHAKLMPITSTTHTFDEAPVAQECASVAPTTPGRTGIVEVIGTGNRRRVIEVHGLNLDQLDPSGIWFIEPGAGGGEPIRTNRAASVARFTSTGQRGSVDTMDRCRLERQADMVASGRYRKEPTNQ